MTDSDMGRTTLLHEMKSSDGEYFASHSEGYGHVSKESEDEIYDPIGLDNEPIQSRDFDVVESKVWYDTIRSKNPAYFKYLSFLRWFLTGLVGLLTAAVGALIAGASLETGGFKLDVMQNFVGGGRFGLGYLSHLGLSLGLTLVALGCCWLEPAAVGSGVPEIKCSLNGMKIPRTVRSRTLLAKVVGVIASVCSGLPIGKEGPMIHIGGIIAAGLSQGKSNTLSFDTSFSKFSGFRNDAEKRDFISCGAAAGVASAFGAPLGGVLLALEGGSSFWSGALTWRSFFCALVATATLSLIFTFWRVSENDTGGLPGMFTFGDFNQNESQTQYEIWELPFMACIGCISGLLGALYVHLTSIISMWRKKKYVDRRRPWIESLSILFVYSSFAFAMAFAYRNNCHKIPEKDNYESSYVRFSCPEGEFNEMATLFFCPGEDLIRVMFHSEHSFYLSSTIIYFIVFFGSAIGIYGLPVPAGIFVPTLLAGSLLGRIVGQMLQGLFPTRVNAGTYALIGAASLLCGVTRMTLSLAVMMLEATGDIQYALPLMVAVMFAKIVGDAFYDGGVYEKKIENAHLPFLEPEPPFEAEFLEARDIMNTDIKCLPVVCKVEEILQALNQSDLSGFPVVSLNTIKKIITEPLPSIAETTGESKEGLDDSKETRALSKPINTLKEFVPPPLPEKSKEPLWGQIRGLILKKHLCTILAKKAFVHSNKGRPNPGDHKAQLTWSDFESNYPRYPELREIEITDEEKQYWVDLSPYMHRDPLVLYPFSRASHVYRVFRTIGLRHLPIVNHRFEVVGIITRKSLTRTNIKKKRKLMIEWEKKDIRITSPPATTTTGLTEISIN